MPADRGAVPGGGNQLTLPSCALLVAVIFAVLNCRPSTVENEYLSPKRCSDELRQDAGTGQKHHHDPGRQLPNGKEQEACERQGEIARRQNRARPDRIVESRTKNADHGCVAATHSRLSGGACAH